MMLRLKSITIINSTFNRTLATIVVKTPSTPMLLENYPVETHDQLPMFTISKSRGFLPRKDPLINLPKQFEPIESLLNRMTIKQSNATSGLLKFGHLGEAVDFELKGCEMLKFVNQVILSKDQNLMSALFRDYCFLTSAYLLEPVDQHFRATGKYTIGRNILPESLAKPLKALADALGHYPFMEYASSYALQNYQRINSTSTTSNNGSSLGNLKEWETDNLKVIRAFEDLDGSEAGFILVHVSMVAFTGKCITFTEEILKFASEGNIKGFNFNMKNLLNTYEEINKVMDTMWSWSRPIDYLKFRSFIFGTGPEKMNTMFPNGVIYEGVSTEPQYFRGESGANDSIIPLADNLLEITASLPINELTKTLREFRLYRPNSQRIYLEGLEFRATQIGIKNFATCRGDDESLALYILMVDQVREFRNRHWNFTKEYIIKRSDFPLATGGSPILKYLPSNLSTVLKVLNETLNLLTNTSNLNPTLAKRIEECRERSITQLKVLEKEVNKLKSQVNGIDDKRILKRGSIGCDGVG